MEKAVHLQVNEILENNTLSSSSQSGYTRKRSIELATTLLLDQIHKEVSNGNLAAELFIDLTKAFDTLGHSRLLVKSKAYVF